MTLMVSHEVEMRLRRKAARTGQDVGVLAGMLLSSVLDDEASEEELRAEYHDLVDMEMKGGLSNFQVARLRQVKARLDDWDERNPAIQALYRRLDQDDDKLDRILALLEDHSNAQN